MDEMRPGGLAECAAWQGQVVSRAQAYALGVSRGEARAQVRAGRWRRVGRHCLCLHSGPLTEEARYWSAVLEGGNL